MLSIWEAFIGLNEAHTAGSTMHPAGCEICSAARTLCLAVLEEAFRHEFVQITTESDAHRLALRAQIETLGK